MFRDKIFHFFQSKYWCLWLLVLYIPLIFLGFGSDSDTYSSLNVWNNFLQTGKYVPSRLPGYVLHEFSIYFLTKIGGSVLSNLVTLLFAALTCLMVIKLLHHYSLPTNAVLLLILNPYFIASATCTIDYIWALCFFTIGLYFFIKRQFLLSSLFFAFASATRLSYGLLVLGIYVVQFIILIVSNRKSVFRFVLGCFIILIINILFYYLPLNFTHWDLSRMFTGSIGDASLWSPFMRIGRWGYKNLLLWGIPSVFALLLSLMIAFKKGISKFLHAEFLWIAIAIVLLTEAMFFKYPIEIEYLLPLLPIAAIFLGISFRSRPRLIPILSVLILINGFIAISLAQPDVPNHASSAIFSIRPTKGLLLLEIENRPPFEAEHYNANNWWFDERSEYQSISPIE